MKIKMMIMGLVMSAGIVSADIVYQDDFNGGSAGLAAFASVPEISQTGYSAASAGVSLNGSGQIYASSLLANANLQFKIATDPLTDDPATTAIKWTAVLKTPTTTTGYVGIGLMENEGTGFFGTTVNSGPSVIFTKTNVRAYGGGGALNASPNYTATYTAGDVITAEVTYNIGAQTLDIDIDGESFVSGWAFNHEFPAGTLVAPVVDRAQIVLSNQPTDGAYVDSFQIETIPEPATISLILIASCGMLLIRRRYF